MLWNLSPTKEGDDHIIEKLEHPEALGITSRD
jgi:hypothetical protein